MALVRVSLSCALLAIAASTAVAQPASSRIVQVGGDGSAQVIGDFNITVINNDHSQKIYRISPRHLAKIIRKVVREELAAARADEVAAVQARNDELEAAQARSTAEIAALNERLLAESSATRVQAEAVVARSAALQVEVATLPPEQRAEAEHALAEVELDLVTRLLNDERRDRQDSGTQRGAAFAMLAWQRGQGPGGWTAGLRFNISASKADGAGGLASVRMVSMVEVAGGQVALASGSTWRFSLAAAIGPRVRVGRRRGLLVSAYYYAPVIVREGDDWLFPLVGAGASVGYHWGFSHAGVVAQYATTRPIYDRGHDTYFLGLDVGWFGTR